MLAGDWAGILNLILQFLPFLFESNGHYGDKCIMKFHVSRCLEWDFEFDFTISVPFIFIIDTTGINK